MLRLNVSSLENLRYYLLLENRSLDELKDQLRGKWDPDPETKRKVESGHALAKFLQYATPGELTRADSEGWRFVFAIDDEISLPIAREVKCEKTFETPTGPVTLVGKCDGLDGTSLSDDKLTERPDPEKYVDSLQWRAYLTMFIAHRFVYRLWQASYAENVVTIRACEEVSFYRYPGMADDVQKAVERLAAVVREHCPELDTP